MASMRFISVTLLAIFAAFPSCLGKTVQYDWDVREWVVDFLRPTINTSTLCIGRDSTFDLCGSAVSPTARDLPFNIPRDRLKNALLINGQYPGPLIEAEEGDTIEVTVRNNMQGTSTIFHWHGLWLTDTPWDDGPFEVTGGSIAPGQSYKYSFQAFPAGTHYYHSHMDALQQSMGLKGPVVIHPKKDRYDRAKYIDKVIMLSDEWQNPEVCFKMDGAMPGNPACSDAVYTSFNGQYGDGSATTPYPLVEVEKGLCYRLRFISSANNAENYIISIDGHNMTLVSVDGGDVEPKHVRSFNLINGGRHDILLCADQEPGHYKIAANYNYGCGMLKGHHFPVPGFDDVEACWWYAFLRYKNAPSVDPGPLPDAYRPFYPYFDVPKGTGGGAKPKDFSGEDFDITIFDSMKTLRTLPEENTYEEWPEEQDMVITMSSGLKNPSEYDTSSLPSSKGRWYIDVDDRRQPWTRPKSPLLHTKAGCGAEDVPVINISSKVRHVEIVMNNLSPTQHTMHMHGQTFRVVGMADFKWCTVNKTSCFLLPKELNPCPAGDRDFGDRENPMVKVPDYSRMSKEHALRLPWVSTPLYWGCKYNRQTDARYRVPVNQAPAVDSVSLWQRSWLVLRVKFDKPGTWLFHCHLQPHIPLGMLAVFNVLPEQQPALPQKAQAMHFGPCPVANPGHVPRHIRVVEDDFLV
eukprot:TRINITY_DN1935_c0_g1_i4.p1 TRINITY_DN1935_c0_g1~~TRINITY_DN1935_c0_g1_i4.p1  ORF type:complete len:689 (-),score=104.98 TRINITY_DN1935_c0_g1_i4:318-2384(-)